MNTTAELEELEPQDAPQVLPAQVTRRSLLGGILAAALAPAFLSRAWAGRPPQEPIKSALPTQHATAGIPRCQHASAPLSQGRVLVAGGRRHSDLPVSVPPMAGVQIYDAQAGVWTAAASMHTARAQHAAVSLPDGRVLVAGGMGHAPLTSVEIYDPAADTWTAVSPMPQALYGHSAACTGGAVLISGGFSSSPPQSSFQSYDIASDTWRIVG